MSIVSRKCLTQGVLERVAQILAATSGGLKGSEIGFFQQCKIVDVDPTNTKWKRLYNAFVVEQNKS